MQKNQDHFLYWTPKILQMLSYPFAYAFFNTRYKVKINGIENVRNTKEPVIFASNHLTEIDPILVRYGIGMFVNPIYYVSLAREYYDKNRLGWKAHFYGGQLFKVYGAYPIFKGMKDYEKGLSNHLSLLRQGRNICIFPEGKISKNGEPREIRGGVTYLAYKTKAPIIPVHIEFKTKKIIEVSYGKPILHGHLFENRPIKIEDFKKKAEFIMSR